MTAPTRNVAINLFQLVGTALPNARVVFGLSRAITLSDNSGLVPAGTATVTCDANGIGTAALVPNALGKTPTQYTAEVYDEQGNRVFPARGFARFYLQDQDSLLHAILFSVPPMSQSDADAAVTDSRNWAQYVTGDVPGAPALSRSSMSWAQGNLIGATYGGSARDWAQGAGLIDGVTYKSARAYALDTAADRLQTGLDRAQVSLDRAQADADVVVANAAAANSQGGALTATAQASLAVVMAASIGSVAQQDLSGAQLAALHRSPADPVATFLYQPRLDSKPEWVDQCQDKSWYVAPNGTWASHPNANGIQSEGVARAMGGTLNVTNLMAAANGTTVGWVAVGGSSANLTLGTNNRLRITNGAAAAGAANWTVALTAGQVYVLYADLMQGSSTAAPYARVSNDNGISWNVLALTTTGAGVFSAPTTGNYLVQFGNSNSNLGYYFEVGNVHLHQVTAFAGSGSYYNSATDGKCYRVWKNLLKATEDLTQAAWTKTNTSVVSGVADPNGGTAAFRLTATAATGNCYQSFAAPASSVQAVTSVWLRRVSGTGTIRIYGADGTTFTDVTATLTGGAWQRITAPVTTAFSNGFYFGGEIVITTSGDVIEYAFPQLELGTVVTAYEAKGIADGSQTETYDGNQAKPPRDWGFVVEQSRCTIYALDLPGRPMWKVIAWGVNATGASVLQFFSNAPNLLSVFAKEGKVVLGANSAGSGFIFDFAKDDVLPVNASAWVSSKRRIGQRQESGHVLVSAGGAVLAGGASFVNGIAMHTPANAPVDPVTGLSIPYIVMTTNAGGTVLRPDFSQASGWSSTALPMVGSGSYGPCRFLATGHVWAQPITGVSAWYGSLISPDFSTALNLTFYNNSVGVGGSQANISFTNVVGAEAPAASATSKFEVGVVTGSVSGNLVRTFSRIRPNPTNLALSLVNRIRTEYNTGWMWAGTQRCLADAGVVGAMSGVEKTVNGDFGTNDFTGWTLLSGAAGSVAAGVATVSTSGGIRTVYGQSIAVDIGKSYRLSAGVIGGTGTGQVRLGNSLAFTSQEYGAVQNGQSIVFTPTQATVYMTFGDASGTNGNTATFDTINLVEVAADRSYRGGSVNIFGNPTRSQVAAGSQLSCIGGFSATNYLREPAHSTDVDPGTGAFRWSDWINVPANPQLNQNLMPKSTLFGAGSSWSQDGLTVADNDVVSNGITYAKLQQPAVTTAGNRIFWFSTSTIVGATVNNSIYVQRVAASTDRLRLLLVGSWGDVATHVFDPVTQAFTSGGVGWVITVIDANTVRLSRATTKSSNGASGYVNVDVVRVSDGQSFGGGTGGVRVGAFQMTIGAALLPYEDVPGALTVRCHPTKEYSYANGAYVTMGMGGDGFLMAEVYDNVNPKRTASLSASASAGVGTNYGTGQWVKLAAEYSAGGTLALYVGAALLAQATGSAPLATLTNANAVMTYGQNYALNAPFPGQIALQKVSLGGLPTDAARSFMQDQEKEMFVAGAQVALPDFFSLFGVDHDGQLDKWTVTSFDALSGTASEVCGFVGMVRTDAFAIGGAVNSRYLGVSSRDGERLLVKHGSTAPHGVDIVQPAQNLKEELRRRGEDAARAARQAETFDWTGGFTANLVLSANNFNAVSGLALPPGVSAKGAQVSGTFVPANTVVDTVESAVLLRGSALMTSTANAQAIAFNDFILPPECAPRSVYGAGLLKQEGSTKDYTSQWDGFQYRVHFPTAPGATAFVRVDGRRMA